jgi:hypothetical protein
MIYKVLINAPAIYEEVILAADSEEEAKALACGSALNRAMQAATVTVTSMPDGTRLTE